MNPLLISGFGTSINVDKRKLIVTNRLKKSRLEFNPHKIEHDNIIINALFYNKKNKKRRTSLLH